MLLAIQFSTAGAVAHRRAIRELGVNWPALADGQFWRLLTNVLVEDKPGMRLSILLPFVWVPVAELWLGWRRTAIAFFGADVVASSIAFVGLRIASTRSAWAAAEMVRLDCGTSAAIYGVLAAFAASRRGANWWIPPVLVAQLVVSLWLTTHKLGDAEHVLAATVGLALGLWWRGRPEVIDGV
jgi:hypothetical protein